MFYTVIKHDRHLRTRGKCRKHEPQASVFYITDLLSVKPAANYALRSSGKSLLLVPKVNCSTLGDRAFAHAAPVLWNSLPLTIRSSGSLAIFKKQLKTFLFKKAFNLLE